MCGTEGRLCITRRQFELPARRTKGAPPVIVKSPARSDHRSRRELPRLLPLPQTPQRRRLHRPPLRRRLTPRQHRLRAEAPAPLQSRPRGDPAPMNRRSLIRGAAAMSAASYMRVLGANDRVQLGLIGCGGPRRVRDDRVPEQQAGGRHGRLRHLRRADRQGAAEGQRTRRASTTTASCWRRKKSTRS